MNHVKLVVALAVSAGMTFVSFAYVAPLGVFRWWGDEFPAVHYAVVLFSMLIGIAFGTLFRQIQGGGATIRLGSEIQKMVESRSLTRSLLVAPLVFGVVYAIVARTPADLSDYLLAFQNGFFCESVLRSKVLPEAATTG